MALIKCPECGKKISDKAKACIHCGYPLHEEKECTNVEREDNGNKRHRSLLTEMLEERDEARRFAENPLGEDEGVDLMRMTLPVGWYF